MLDYISRIKDIITEKGGLFLTETKELLLDNFLEKEVWINYFSNYWFIYVFLIIFLHLLFSSNQGLSKMAKDSLQGDYGKRKEDDKRGKIKEEKNYRL